MKWIGKGLSLLLKSFDITDIRIDNMLSVINISKYIISICSNERNKK
jgi:hypothetical protein